MIATGLEKSLISEYSGWDGDTWTITFHDAVLRVPLNGYPIGSVVDLSLDIEKGKWEIYDYDGQLQDSGPLSLVAS